MFLSSQFSLASRTGPSAPGCHLRQRIRRIPAGALFRPSLLGLKLFVWGFASFEHTPPTHSSFDPSTLREVNAFLLFFHLSLIFVSLPLLRTGFHASVRMLINVRPIAPFCPTVSFLWAGGACGSVGVWQGEKAFAPKIRHCRE